MTQVLLLALFATVVTVPSVLLIPRARQSPLFDRVLWGATWVLAFLSAWAAPGYLAMDWYLAAAIGAAIGALSLNVLLWLMDRLPQSEVGDATVAEEESGEPDSQ
jgi:hypothetical protein